MTSTGAGFDPIGASQKSAAHISSDPDTDYLHSTRFAETGIDVTAISIDCPAMQYELPAQYPASSRFGLIYRPAIPDLSSALPERRLALHLPALVILLRTAFAFPVRSGMLAGENTILRQQEMSVVRKPDC
ncbi:MAG: hypothetical protein ACT6QU_12850 [Aliihoeflea sp.]|uniref:hypothetical protein n=1 Tax=Aliihoeflea sp. TaxID=2608088 RepID=UPI004037FD0D